ncbi:VanZ family protein [Microvirga thermotolerans]|uniref:VanZ family protein n=1 Tax=Microvirga thermotolerans TaxID=2651334 RepID=A0A5P9K1Q6_9HYPH|nr:VanZ family protein [Microvirga thermotolerans]QFU17886.1 VanZ family protein [Microvirga thermotolerans]
MGLSEGRERFAGSGRAVGRGAARIGAWCLLILVAVVTLSPIGLRPVSGAPVDLERMAAFLLLGGLFAWGYPERRLRLMVLLAASAGVLETLQNFVPGRHGRADDFLVKGMAIVAGFLICAMAERIATASQERRRSRLRP